jgi:hypothetical protein
LHSFDLYIATRTHQLPGFTLAQQPYKSLTRSEAVLIDSQTSNLGRVQHIDLVRGISKVLYLHLTCMTKLIHLADLYCADPNSALYTRLLVLGRNRVQHALLSSAASRYDPSAFAPSNDLAATDNDLASTEAIRIAALIFSDMAFFPLPWALDVKTRLAERMRRVWEIGNLRRLVAASKDNYSVLHACLLWLGCLAALGSAHQEWFEVELLHLIGDIYGQPSQTFGFEEVRAVLQGFLWWEPVSGRPSKDLWSRLVDRVAATKAVEGLALRPVMEAPLPSET